MFLMQLLSHSLPEFLQDISAIGFDHPVCEVYKGGGWEAVRAAKSSLNSILTMLEAVSLTP